MIKTKKTVADYPELVIQWDLIKNGELKPENVSFGSNRRIHWKCYDGKWPDGSCANDHEWEATVGNRIGRQSGWSEQETMANVFKETDKLNTKLDKIIKELKEIKEKQSR